MPVNSICFINSSRSWGGGEKWHYDHALFLAEKGYAVHVVTNVRSTLYKKLKEHAGIQLFPIKINNFSFINPLRGVQLIRILKKINPQTVIINLPADLKLMATSSWFLQINHIIYRRGSAIAVKNSALNRYIFRNIVTHIIVNSLATKQTLLQNNKNLIAEKKIKLLYNGIDLKSYPKQASETKQKTSAELIIGHLGRFSREKNQQFLIDVALELKQTQVPFHFILGGEGPDLERIKTLVEESQLTKYFTFPGFIKDTHQFMKSIDLFVLPSLWEGFGYVTIEAMAHEKPVIAFNITSNREIIENKVTGFLTEENDSHTFAEKIQYFYEHRDKVSEMGVKGRLRVARYFNSQDRFTEFETFIKNL
ncbi:MAG: glycosyltransferase [Bacteroidales bacterium]|jgi:glycosyltransferase involved in cell wall biosynthesis|nr:glycosyltransferase [Bacteroidales bacterium]